MKTLGTSELLEVWEWGINKPLIDRILRLLAVSFETDDIEQITSMSIGERDNYLFLLRRNLFGRQMNCTLDCPECGEIIEWESDIDEFCSPDYSTQITHELSFKREKIELKFRLPTSNDFILTETDSPNDDFSRYLISLCITEIIRDSKHLKKEKLPENILKEIESRMEEADPMANIQLSLSCPNCGHHCNEIFDILSFFWKEIDFWAERLLQDICVLALNYGWSEKDILEMSPLRRQIYLNSL